MQLGEQQFIKIPIKAVVISSSAHGGLVTIYDRHFYYKQIPYRCMTLLWGPKVVMITLSRDVVYIYTDELYRHYRTVFVWRDAFKIRFWIR